MLRSEDPTIRPVQAILASLGRPLVGAEIGVANGVNAGMLLQNVPVEKLFLVDPWGKYVQDGHPWDFTPSYDEVVRLFAAEPRVSIMRTDSVAAAVSFQERSLDFVYIDACHEERSVAQDIAAWLPKVKLGGILCGHDFATEWPGVVNAVLKAAQAARAGNWDLRTRTPEWWWVVE